MLTRITTLKSRSRSQILLFVLPYPADHQPECTFPGTSKNLHFYKSIYSSFLSPIRREPCYLLNCDHNIQPLTINQPSLWSVPAPGLLGREASRAPSTHQSSPRGPQIRNPGLGRRSSCMGF